MEVRSYGSAGPPLAPSLGLTFFHEISPGLWHCSWMSHLPDRQPGKNRIGWMWTVDIFIGVATLHLGPGNYVELQFLIHQAGPSLRQVTLVQNQTVTAKAAGAAQFLEPFCPLRVQLAVGLLILRFEDTDDLLQREEEKVKLGQLCTKQKLMFRNVEEKVQLDKNKHSPQQVCESLF